MRYSLRHEHATAVLVTDGDSVELELRLTPQARRDEETGQLMMRFPPFANVIAHGDPEREDLVEKAKAGLIDYLEAYIELNGPERLLGLFRSLGFEDVPDGAIGSPTWQDVHMVPIHQSLRGNARSHC